MRESDKTLIRAEMTVFLKMLNEAMSKWLRSWENCALLLTNKQFQHAIYKVDIFSNSSWDNRAIV